MNMKKTTSLLLAALAALFTLPTAACGGEEEKLCSYDISATYSAEERTLTGTVTFDYFNDTGSEISDLKFNLWGNAYREGATYSPVSRESQSAAYYDGTNYGGMEITSVEGCSAWEVCGEDENILSVALPASVFPDERASVTISYTLTLAKVNHRTGVTEENCVNLGNFYPVLCAYTGEGFVQTPYYPTGDPFVSECADYKVTFTLPENYIAATSGKETSRTAAEGKIIVSYSLANARDFAAVLSDGFSTESVRTGDTTITVYYTGDQAPAKVGEVAAASLEYFSEKFGEYAYPTLSVAMTSLSVSGMEYPALVMIDDDLDTSDAVYTTVHETAHQWWYAMVGSDQVRAAWQDEGLAEYSTLCFFESNPVYGFTRTAMLDAATRAYRAYYSVYSQIFGEADTTMTRSLDQFAGDYEYANIAYNKALIMFDALRSAMGDDRFFGALRNYFERCKFTLAGEEHLIAALDEKYDVEGMIDGFLSGKTII